MTTRSPDAAAAARAPGAPRLPLTGGCQCGAVRFAAAGPPLTFYACHCTQCRGQSGAAFGLSLLVRPEDLSLDRAKLATWSRPRASGGEVLCRFCPDCGSRLIHEGGDAVSIKGGALDDPWALKLAGHIWAERAAPWMQAAFAAGDVVAARDPSAREAAALRARFAALNRFR